MVPGSEQNPRQTGLAPRDHLPSGKPLEPLGKHWLPNRNEVSQIGVRSPRETELPKPRRLGQSIMPKGERPASMERKLPNENILPAGRLYCTNSGKFASEVK